VDDLNNTFLYDYFLGDVNDQIERDEHQNLHLICGERRGDWMKIEFERKLNTGDQTYDLVIEIGNEYVVKWENNNNYDDNTIFHPSRMVKGLLSNPPSTVIFSTEVKEEDSSSSSSSLPSSSSSSSVDEDDRLRNEYIRSMQKAHGIAMIVGFVVCMSFGVIIVRFLRGNFGRLWFRFYLLLQCFGLFVLFVGILFAMLFDDHFPDSLFFQPHHLFGFILIFLLFILIMLGILADRKLTVMQANPSFQTPVYPNKAHGYIGWVTMVLVVVTNMLGAIEMRVNAASWALLSVVQAIPISYMLFLYFKTSSNRGGNWVPGYVSMETIKLPPKLPKKNPFYSMNNNSNSNNNNEDEDSTNINEEEKSTLKITGIVEDPLEIEEDIEATTTPQLPRSPNDILQIRIFVAVWVVTFGVAIALGVVM